MGYWMFERVYCKEHWLTECVSFRKLSIAPCKTSSLLFISSTKLWAKHGWSVFGLFAQNIICDFVISWSCTGDSGKITKAASARDLQPRTAYLPHVWRVLFSPFFLLQITQSLVFTVLSSVFSAVVSLPFNVYSTFVIEERHGFNKQV